MPPQRFEEPEFRRQTRVDIIEAPCSVVKIDISQARPEQRGAAHTHNNKVSSVVSIHESIFTSDRVLSYWADLLESEPRTEL
ncbi:hypothetical protein J6590_065019 [Homalodisca vitripennis]|nr:hypothetical protein J6590_065019 [Homalodisca vitripennis]